MKEQSIDRFYRCLLIYVLVCCLGASVAAGMSTVQDKDPRIAESNKLIQSGAALLEQGKFDEAYVDLDKASKLNPEDFRPHALSGLGYMAQMKMRSASEAFARAIKLQPQNKQLYLLKATADVRRSAPEEAIAACKKALEIDPNSAEAYMIIGESLRGDDKHQAEAIEAYRKAIKISPTLLEAFEGLGQIFEDAKDEKSAEEVFRQGMAADPKHMSGRFAIGRLLVKQGRLAEARELWDGRTSDEDKYEPKFIELLTRAENLKKATDALAQKPKDPDALIDMGMAVMDGDSWVIDYRQKRAMVYFKQALKLKPNYARAQYAICKAYIQMEEKKIADQELGKLRKLDPKLADELEEYRKNYTVGIISTGPPIKIDQ